MLLQKSITTDPFGLGVTFVGVVCPGITDCVPDIELPD